MTFTVTRQRAQQVNDMARARDGLPYSYGGAFTRNPAVSTDCSGLVLQTAAWFSDRPDWPGNRYGSTESFRLDSKIVYDLGFKRMPAGGLSALPFTPVMLVGVQHGGGGRYSHTACTLMTMDYPGGPVTVAKRGVDWESQGGGVFLYEGARAWNDPLFHDFWYLDAKLENVPAPSGSDDDAVSVLAAATGISEARALEIMATLRDGLALSECTTVNRIAYWLAQMGHESGGFQYTEEIDKNGRYAPYIGRTWIQITWEDNYRQFSQWCFARQLVDSPDYFVENYEKLRDSQWAGIGPAWYWTVARPDINSLCDKGDFDKVTFRINGGQNGADDRRRRLNLALAQGDRLLALVAEKDSSKEEVTLMSDHLYQSVSIYKTPGEGARYTLAQLIQSIDGFAHREAVEQAALNGSVDDLDKIFRVAAGKGSYKDAWAISHARKFLARLERENPAALEAYRQAKGIA